MGRDRRSSHPALVTHARDADGSARSIAALADCAPRMGEGAAAVVERGVCRRSGQCAVQCRGAGRAAAEGASEQRAQTQDGRA